MYDRSALSGNKNVVGNNAQVGRELQHIAVARHGLEGDLWYVAVWI